MTPHAGQGTAFQENRRPDSWPVMDRKFPDIEDNAVGHERGSDQ
jgi:hypothetical protein